MKEFVKNSKGILLTALSIVLLIAILITASLAWFYFPTAESVTVESDIQHEIDVDLYQYNESLGYFVKAGLNAAEDTVVATCGTEATFVEWGGIFYPTNDITDYYMLMLTYPDDDFLNGNLEAYVGMMLRSGMNGTEANYKIVYTTIEYAISGAADINPASTDAITTVQAAEYTRIFQPPVEAPTPPEDAPLDYIEQDHLSITLKNLTEEQYIYTYGGESKCRLVLFFRIKSDASRISQTMSWYGVSFFVLQIDTKNIYTFTCNFRSIPYKSADAGFDRIYVLAHDRKERPL